MYFKRKELEKFRSFKGPLIDVRFLIKIMNFLSEYIALEEECVHKALLGY